MTFDNHRAPGVVCANLDEHDVERLSRYKAVTSQTWQEAVTVIVKTYLHQWDRAVQGHDVQPIQHPERKHGDDHRT